MYRKDITYKNHTRADRTLAKLVLCGLLLFCGACPGALEDIDRFAPPAPDGGDTTLDSGSPGDGDDAGEADDSGTTGNDAGSTDDGGTVGDDGGSNDGGVVLDAGTPVGCNALTTILKPTCATALCHSSGTQQGSLDLQSPGLPNRLVNVPASGGPGLLINPANPDASVLYTKTLKPPPFGAQMPLLGKALNSSQLACLKSWIHQAVGAP